MSKRLRKFNNRTATAQKTNLVSTIQPLGFRNKPQVTDEGFLLVDVVIVATGVLRYEYQVNGGNIIARDELLSPESIFDPEFIQSCNGIPFVLEHPQNDAGEFVDVSPDNFNELIKGVLINPRADKANGELLGTLKIFDADVRELIESDELEEVSSIHSRRRKKFLSNGRPRNRRWPDSDDGNSRKFPLCG